MESIVNAIATLFLALGFLFFFGPIIVLISIIGRLEISGIKIDLTGQSTNSRTIIAVIGVGTWLAIYIPLILLANKAIPLIISDSRVIITPTASVIATKIEGLSSTVTPTILPVLSANTPTVVKISTETEVSTNTAAPTVSSSQTQTPITIDPTSIIISEVLGNPCGADSRNEFIELYNSGKDPVDVSGWWITDGDEADKIVSWQSRYSTIDIGFETKQETTVIPPKGYAVILAPGYPYIRDYYRMPYAFSKETIILTVEKGQLLGDEVNAIEVSNYDVIVLYKGSEEYVDKFISSYGSPFISNSPTRIKDDGRDTIPFYKSPDEDKCWSVERIFAVNDDVDSNWRRTWKSSPGSGDFK